MRISKGLITVTILATGCVRGVPTSDGPVDTSPDSQSYDYCSNEPDDCHQQACELCNDSCEEPCLVMESWPQQYGCEGGDTITVYEVCSDWTPDY